jgi:predicted nucleotidyltransferase component of viral defense system
MKNVAASVRQRLMNLAKARGVAFNRVLVQYGIERVLYRLAESKHSDKFILKGAMLFVIWQGVQHRETRDLDLLGFGENSIEALTRVFEEVCAKAVVDDGLTFESVTAQPITALQEYGGVSVKINARLEAARIVINVDVGFGDQVTPRPALVDFPALLDFPAPRIRAYPVETVVAEKFHALVALGERNTRMKDFFDLYYLSATFDFEGGRFLRAIERTFERRNTPLPSTLPVALTESFALANEGMWSAFLRRSEQEKKTQFVTVIETLRGFLEPVFRNANLRASHWVKGGPWRAEK